VFLLLRVGRIREESGSALLAFQKYGGIPAREQESLEVFHVRLNVYIILRGSESAHLHARLHASCSSFVRKFRRDVTFCYVAAQNPLSRIRSYLRGRRSSSLEFSRHAGID